MPRIAVVGCGVWGRNHVRNHAELGSLAAIVERTPATAAALSAQHGVPARSFDEVLDDPAIDALVFALPPSLNTAFGRQALEAGKHLFVEKPMALTTADGESLCRLAAAQGRVLMVGHILHYHPAFRRLAELVRAGRFGRLLSVASTRLDLGRIRREEDAMWALAPHDISMVLALTGSEPSGVAASGQCLTHPDIADVTDLRLGFASGATATIRSSWLHPFKEQRLVVIGEAGMAVFDDREPWERKLALYDHQFEDRGGVPFAVPAEPEWAPLSPAEPLRAECRHFVDCVRTGASPISDGREGLRVLSVLERASASLDRARLAA